MNAAKIKLNILRARACAYAITCHEPIREFEMITAGNWNKYPQYSVAYSCGDLSRMPNLVPKSREEEKDE